MVLFISVFEVKIMFSCHVMGPRLFETVDEVLIGYSIYYYTISTYAQPLFFITDPPIW